MTGGCSITGSNSGRSRARDGDSRTNDSSRTRGRTLKSHNKPRRKDCPKEAKTDEKCVDDDHLSECFQSSVAISEPSDRNCPVLLVKDGTKVSSTRCTSKFSKEEESSDQQNVEKNSSEKASKVSSKARKSRKTKAQKQNDKPTQAEQKMSTWSSDNSELPSKGNHVQTCSSPKKRSGNKKKSHSSEVGREKTKSKSVSQSKSSSKYVKRSSKEEKRNSEPASPTYHIARDGTYKVFEETNEKRCPLCNKYLSSLPSYEDYKHYDDFEPLNLPDVAVLSCGHVFHSECLFSVTPDEQSLDPPCFVCLSCIP